MRLLKFLYTMILSLILIFIISGCQKDEVTSKSSEIEKTEDTTKSKPNDNTNNNQNSINKEDDNTQDNKNKLPESKIESQKQSESSLKKTSDPASQKSEKTNMDQQKKSEIQNTSKESNSKLKTERKNINSKSTATKKAPPKQVPNDPELTATISITGEGTILPNSKVVLTKGDTILAVTQKILKSKGIPIEVRGSGSRAYVEGIANLYEFDRGPLSGWTVKRNGKVLDRSVGAITVNNGDSLQWVYTSDYTKDTK